MKLDETKKISETLRNDLVCLTEEYFRDFYLVPNSISEKITIEFIDKKRDNRSLLWAVIKNNEYEKLTDILNRFEVIENNIFVDIMSYFRDFTVFDKKTNLANFKLREAFYRIIEVYKTRYVFSLQDFLNCHFFRLDIEFPLIGNKEDVFELYSILKNHKTSVTWYPINNIEIKHIKTLPIEVMFTYLVDVKELF
jgi:hypothetical protein